MSTRVLDLTRTSPAPPLEVTASPAVDFVIGILVFASPETVDTLDEGPAWFDEVRTLASAELLNELGWFDQGAGKLLGSLIGPAVLPRPAPNVPDYIERLAALDPVDLWLLLCGARVPPVRDALGGEIVADAARGDAAAREEVRRRATVLAPEEEAEFDALLSRSADETHELSIRFLRRWYHDIYERREADVAEALERDAHAKRRLARSMTPLSLIESATNGLEFATEPWIRHVILTPHIAMRPWNVMSGHDQSAILCYPVADESLGIDPTAPPPKMVRLHRALGDEKRLRMLKVLTKGPASLQELATAAGLAKSSAHHHLVILRSAGLVKATTSGDGRYSLRREGVAEAGATLAEFLGEEAR